MNEIKKAGYWWECTVCDNHWRKKTEDERGIMDFICHELVPSGWDQTLLERPCPDCEEEKRTPPGVLRIAFFDNTSKKATPRVILLHHAVGLTWDHDHNPVEPEDITHSWDLAAWVPMLWEWHYKVGDPVPRFQINYIDLEKKSWQSLKTVSPLTQGELRRLYELYCSRADIRPATGMCCFPW